MEGIDFSVVADLPAFREARLQFGGAHLKVNQPVINRNRAGVHAGTGGVELRIEILRRSFGYSKTPTKLKYSIFNAICYFTVFSYSTIMDCFCLFFAVLLLSAPHTAPQKRGSDKAWRSSP